MFHCLGVWGAAGAGTWGSVRLPSLPLASRAIRGQLHPVSTRTGDTWFCRCVTLNLRGATCTSGCLAATPLSSVCGLIARKPRGWRGRLGAASLGAASPGGRGWDSARQADHGTCCRRPDPRNSAARSAPPPALHLDLEPV